MTQDLTTLICLFHHKDQAHAALEEILKAGIPEANVTLIGDAGSRIAANVSSLDALNVPVKDRQHLLDGLNKGGAVLTVAALSDHADKVEAIFKAHRADKIDEDIVDDDLSASALPVAPLDAPFGTSASLPLTGQGYEVASDALMAERLRQVRVYRLADVPVTLTGITSTSAPELFDPEEDSVLQEEVDPRELGLDARMKPVEEIR